jgi:hypothetical protein
VFAPTTGGGADYDLNFIIRNCLLVTTGPVVCVSLNTTGALANKPGGVVILSSTIAGGGTGINAVGANWSTTIPNRVYNCWIIGLSTGLLAAALGQIVEDYNLIQCNTARNNVTAGANSVTGYNYAPLADYGYSHLLGFQRRVLWEPTAGGPMLGFGNQSSPVPPTVDLTGRPRPAGGSSTLNAVGCYERHDTAVRSSAANADGGSGAAIELTGPSDQDVQIPVEAASTTISIKVKWDATHGDANKPQAILLANGEVGVTTQTVTAAGTAGSAYETLTFAAFTPTAKGWITLRLVSRAAAGGGKAWFDTVSVI